MTRTWPAARRTGAREPGTGPEGHAHTDSASARTGEAVVADAGPEGEDSGSGGRGTRSPGEGRHGDVPADVSLGGGTAGDLPGDGSREEPSEGEPGGGLAHRPANRRAGSGRRPGPRLRRAVAAGVAAALVLGGCAFLHAAHQLRSAESARNRALTDTEATSRVAGDVGNALARIFSYTPDGTAAAERSARAVLDGRAARQYATLFDRVRQDLAAQRVTLSTRAVRTGVVELDGDRARLLVFLDQTSRRGGDAATTAAAQLTVTARLEDDRWRIVDIKAR